MKKLFVSILTLSTLMAATSCRPKQQQKENVIPVTVMEVQDVQSSYTRSYIGTVVSKHSTILLAPAEGTVVKIPVRQGQQVSKNTLIVKVDSPMAKGMKKTADASLSQARDGYAYQLCAGGRQPEALGNGGVYIRSMRVAHRLHDDGGAAAYHEVIADPYFTAYQPFHKLCPLLAA